MQGRVYLAKGDFDPALKIFDAALKINPQYVEIQATNLMYLNKPSSSFWKRMYKTLKFVKTVLEVYLHI